MNKKHNRTGVFRGTFDPLHEGHIAFALRAIEEAKLDRVYFLIEPNPRHKKSVTDISARIKLVSSELKKHQNLSVLNLGDSYSENDSITPIKNKLKSTTIAFLMGSDVAKTLNKWPNLRAVTEDCELVVGLRGNDNDGDIRALLKSLKYKPKNWIIISSPLPYESSTITKERLLS